MKFAIVTFSRGSGSCHDEETRVFFGDTWEEIEENVNAYKDKYYPDWDKYVEFDDASDLDECKSINVSSHYS